MGTAVGWTGFAGRKPSTVQSIVHDAEPLNSGPNVSMTSVAIQTSIVAVQIGFTRKTRAVPGCQAAVLWSRGCVEDSYSSARALRMGRVSAASSLRRAW